MFIAALLGFCGTALTYTSFYEPVYAEDAVLTLLPCAAVVWALPAGKRRTKKKCAKQTTSSVPSQRHRSGLPRSRHPWATQR
jgi:hypothetical protein